MKIAVGFFNEKKGRKVNEIFELGILVFFRYGILIIIISFFIFFCGMEFLKNKIVNTNVLCVASNIVAIEKYNLDKNELLASINKSIIPFKKVVEKGKKENKKNVESVDKTSKNKDSKFDVSIVDTTDVISKKDKDNLSINNSDSLQKINVYGINISNYSSKRDIDILSLFNKNIVLTKKSDPVLIYCTHTSESYTNSNRYKFDYSSTYRSRDAKYNMLSVASILSKALEERNIQTIFETTPHDYGSYEIAYTNSRKSIQKSLDSTERIGLSIDVHRDALGDLTKGLTTEIKGQKVARLMFVMGVGTNSYSNKYWEDNLALALQLQKLGEEMYPGLFRGLIIRNSKYNQDMVKHSFLVEIGTTGNTLEEAYFGARCLANVLNKFYNN